MDGVFAALLLIALAAVPLGIGLGLFLLIRIHGELAAQTEMMLPPAGADGWGAVDEFFIPNAREVRAANAFQAEKDTADGA